MKKLGKIFPNNPKILGIFFPNIFSVLISLKILKVRFLEVKRILERILRITHLAIFVHFLYCFFGTLKKIMVL